jgi:hypothetical protein
MPENRMGVSAGVSRAAPRRLDLPTASHVERHGGLSDLGWLGLDDLGSALRLAGDSAFGVGREEDGPARADGPGRAPSSRQGRWSAEEERSAAVLRFVVLRHDGIPSPHFDLMIEVTPGSPLITWRCDRWPIEGATELTFLPDHRNAYLEYEGPVSGDRGYVTRIVTGTYTLNCADEGRPYCRDLVLYGEVEQYRLRLLSPPGFPEWSLEPATGR